MNRSGLGRARLHVALLQRHETVAFADQHGAHAGVGIDLPGQFPRDLERDLFFANAGRTVGAGILAAVAGIDGDHQLALARADDVLYGLDRRARGDGVGGRRDSDLGRLRRNDFGRLRGNRVGRRAR